MSSKKLEQKKQSRIIRTWCFYNCKLAFIPRIGGFRAQKPFLRGRRQTCCKAAVWTAVSGLQNICSPPASGDCCAQPQEGGTKTGDTGGPKFGDQLRAMSAKQKIINLVVLIFRANENIGQMVL